MKKEILYVSLFPLIPVFSLTILMTKSIEGPEETIIGTWEETSWRYEKMDHSDQSQITWMEEMDDLVKKEIGGHLIIHQSEEWKFSPDKKLELRSEDNLTKTIVWTLKGRGNILEMTQADGTIESYNIQELTKNKMILHFNSDLQVRGIVAMEFRRGNN